MSHVPLAWLQLTREKRRLLAALAGIAFAVMLMLMQLGFRDALFTSSTLVHNHLRGDLVLISSQYEYLISTGSFTQRRLYQTLAFEDVESVAPLYVGVATFKNTETLQDRRILVLGFNPITNVFDLPSVSRGLRQIEMPDVVLYDARSRPEFGPIEQEFRENNVVITEVGGRKIKIGGLFELGISFAGNGHLITSDSNFLRLFSHRREGLIEIGLITLKGGANPGKVQAQIAAALPKDIKVLTHQEFIDLEKAFWANNSPIGFIFTLGTFMGLTVGAVIVYQILYTDVSDHLAEYATLKAMGYPDRYLYRVVLQEALILSILGFLPGFGIAQALYMITQDATHLPIYMTSGRILVVFTLTVVMCGASGALAMRRLRSADPAEIF